MWQRALVDSRVQPEKGIAMKQPPDWIDLALHLAAFALCLAIGLGVVWLVMASRVPNRVDRIRCLGMAQVPAVVGLAWETLNP